MPFSKGYTPWNKNMKMSDDFCRKVSSSHRGLKIKSLLGNKNASGAHESVRGENNVMWKGDGASYSAIHKWVVVRLGKPNRCDICKSETKRYYDWASKSHECLRDLSDWFRLCRSCHRKYDIINNDYKIAFINKV